MQLGTCFIRPSVDELAKHEGPHQHCSEKALLDMLKEVEAPR